VLAIFAATLLLSRNHAVPCRAALAQSRGSIVAGKKWTCVEYADARTAKGQSLVVYALEDPDRSAYDFGHHVFIALLAPRPGRSWKLLDRSDVTKLMLDVDEDEDHGIFYDMGATIVPFSLKGKRGRFFDVQLWSLLSGSGAISASSDVLLRVDGKHLRRTCTLQFTDGWTRSGWSYIGETRSEIFVGEDGLLLVMRSRVGKTKRPEDPLTVHCRVTRQQYRYVDGKFRSIGPIGAREASRWLGMTALRRDHAYLPCCARCKFTDIH